MSRRSETDSQNTCERTVVLDLPARLDLITVIRMVVVAAATIEDSLVGERVDDLRWIISEASTNGVEASQICGDQGRLRIECTLVDQGVDVTISDDGPGMPETVAVHHIEDPDRLSIEGGFGIPLIRHLATGDVRFDSGEDGTTVSVSVHQR